MNSSSQPLPDYSRLPVGTAVLPEEVAPQDASVGTPTGTVQFQTDGVNFGSPVALAACSPSPDACATSGSTSTLPVPSHSITANFIPSVNFQASTGSLTQTINAKPVAITVTDPAPTYDRNPHSATITVAPNVPVSVTYNGSPTLQPTDPGTYSVAVSVTDPNYFGSQNGTLTINKKDPALALGAT